LFAYPLRLLRAVEQAARSFFARQANPEKMLFLGEKFD
jgi:hypothetical protein